MYEGKGNNLAGDPIGRFRRRNPYGLAPPYENLRGRAPVRDKMSGRERRRTRSLLRDRAARAYG